MRFACLAHSTNPPTGLYLLPSIISFFMRQIFSGSTWPIFTIFSANERYLREFSRPGPPFYSFKDFDMATDFGKICKVTFIQHAGISQRIEHRNSAFEVIKSTIFFYILCNFGDDRSTNCKDLAGSFCTFWDETPKIDISYQISQQVLDQTSPTFQLW